MYAVAITKLGSTADDAAAALAPVLGKAPYDTRLELAAGVPALVATSNDKARAVELAARIRALGHAVLAFDTDAVVASGDMISMKRFRFDVEALSLDDRAAERLPYGDVFGMIRAVHRFDSDRREEVTTQKISGVRAIASGGLMMTKSVKTEVRHVSNERTNVLYLFQRSGKTPWILRETGTSYAGLGPALGHSQAQNFTTAVRLLRERMPRVPYDERLLTMKRIRTGEALSRAGSSVESSTVPWTDLLAHVVAYTLAQEGQNPYRT